MEKVVEIVGIKPMTGLRHGRDHGGPARGWEHHRGTLPLGGGGWLYGGKEISRKAGVLGLGDAEAG